MLCRRQPRRSNRRASEGPEHRPAIPHDGGEAMGPTAVGWRVEADLPRPWYGVLRRPDPLKQSGVTALHRLIMKTCLVMYAASSVWSARERTTLRPFLRSSSRGLVGISSCWFIHELQPRQTRTMIDCCRTPVSVVTHGSSIFCRYCLGMTCSRVCLVGSPHSGQRQSANSLATDGRLGPRSRASWGIEGSERRTGLSDSEGQRLAHHEHRLSNCEREGQG